MLLELNRTKIHESTKIKYLGLILDRRLNWDFYTNELAKKLSRAVGMLYKIRDSAPINKCTIKPYILVFSIPILHMAFLFGEMPIVNT